MSIPIWEKPTLTIQEAAEYSGIGEQKIRSLTKKRDCDFALFVGNKCLIKRQNFDNFLKTETQI